MVDSNAGRLVRSVMKFVIRGCAAAALAAAALPVAAPAEAAPRLESAIASEVRSERELRDFYRARSYRPLWISGGELRPEAYRLVELIAGSDFDGLDPDHYRPRRLIEAVESAGSGSPKRLAKAEMQLSRAYVRYASDLRRPVKNVGMKYLDPELMPNVPDSRALLEAAAAAPSLSRHIESAAGMNPVYASLREELTNYHNRWSDLPAVQIPSGPTLKVGSSGQRVELLRQRLGVNGYGAFDRSLAAAVSEFQGAHGLPKDGVAGPRTIAALNESPRQREQVIRSNLQRARALPANPGDRYIVVDAAAAKLWMYEDGQVRDTMRVIVGKPDQPTPMLAGMMRYAILNPYWNVPVDLARTRIAANVVKRGVSYLKTNRYEVLSDWTDNAKVIDPKTVDWKAVAAGRKEVRVRQLPGKSNMMGKMKFMMPNDLGIYLHDTPEKNLFNEDERQLSSGCVRLEDAQRLAKWVFGKPLVAKSSTPEQRVPLPEPVPVFITYLTAAPGDRGIAFNSDPYKLDQQQARARGASSVASPR
jgi:L,D-transpeptidase YcbB